ncbi:hypothetical protein [Streptomyces fructofermentans]|uniref:hypothetical protein n=1 Tax=Streptomyces fructofermentans TaxID=152141 RepID=UPI001672E2D8|nr:hypothetical protein [Streptomyces fructofermentans]
MLASSLAQRLADHVQHLLGSGPFPQPGGWTHMGAVICDVSFQPRCNYERALRPRLLRLQLSWPDARTVRGFQRQLATRDLAVAMEFNHAQKVATAHAITDLLAAHGVDTRDDLHTWLGHQVNRAALRTVKGVGPKSIDYIGNLVGRSHVAVDVHLRAFAVDAGVPNLPYDQLRAVYEEAAAILGHDKSGLEHTVWRYRSEAA